MADNNSDSDWLLVANVSIGFFWVNPVVQENMGVNSCAIDG